jgi:hypothetical protein
MRIERGWLIASGVAILMATLTHYGRKKIVIKTIADERVRDLLRLANWTFTTGIVSLGCAVSGEFYSKTGFARLDFLVFW